MRIIGHILAASPWFETILLSSKHFAGLPLEREHLTLCSVRCILNVVRTCCPKTIWWAVYTWLESLLCTRKNGICLLRFVELAITTCCRIDTHPRMTVKTNHTWPDKTIIFFNFILPGPHRRGLGGSWERSSNFICSLVKCSLLKWALKWALILYVHTSWTEIAKRLVLSLLLALSTKTLKSFRRQGNESSSVSIQYK